MVRNCFRESVSGKIKMDRFKMFISVNTNNSSGLFKRKTAS